MVVNCFQVFMIFGLWHQNTTPDIIHIRCELLSSFYDLWSLTSLKLSLEDTNGCELLSSFYDLWSLTSVAQSCSDPYLLWIAFKFLWSLVFDICAVRYWRSIMLWIAFKFLWSLVFDILIRFPVRQHQVVNCFQVFMIFGLWHLNSTKATTAKDYRMSLA